MDLVHSKTKEIYEMLSALAALIQYKTTKT